MWRPQDAWLAAGVRTPFSRVDGALQALDPLELSVPVARHMAGMLKGGRPDFAVWGVVVPKVASCSSNPRKRRPLRSGILLVHYRLSWSQGWS
jgi:hypothetical protein